MNDDDYTGNDEQIQDLKDLVEELHSSLDAMVKTYGALHDGLSDMVGDGEGEARLTPDVIPDDYHWLADSLVNALDTITPAEELVKRLDASDNEPRCTCGHTLADHEHPDGNHQGCRWQADGVTCACDGYEEA